MGGDRRSLRQERRNSRVNDMREQRQADIRDMRSRNGPGGISSILQPWLSNTFPDFRFIFDKLQICFPSQFVLIIFRD